MLELNERFADDGVTELAWRSGITAFRATTPIGQLTTGRPISPHDVHHLS
jgi:hypothetical protein